MKTKRKWVATAIAIVMTSPLMSYSGGTLAAEKTLKADSNAITKPSAAEKALLKSSEAGNSAIEESAHRRDQ